MVSQVKYFERIPALPSRKSILLRLGYNPHLTVLSESHQQNLDEGIVSGAALCNLAGAYCRVRIEEHGPEKVVLENRQVFRSANLAKLLRNSDEVLLMASTVGNDIVESIRQAVSGGNAAHGVILDAVASETADTGLDWIMSILNNLLAKEGKKLTKHRYSPGYGDLPLANQKIIFDMLGLERLHMCLTNELILVPEKSVLAIAGIEAV
ncbi:MAG TPA: methionine synthase [Bacillota bacterium]|nr:methionine synthase [Bacillota bacterium]